MEPTAPVPLWLCTTSSFTVNGLGRRKMIYFLILTLNVNAIFIIFYENAFYSRIRKVTFPVSVKDICLLLLNFINAGAGSGS